MDSQQLTDARLRFIASRVRELAALGWSWGRIAEALGLTVLQVQYLYQYGR